MEYHQSTPRVLVVPIEYPIEYPMEYPVQYPASTPATGSGPRLQQRDVLENRHLEPRLGLRRK